MCTWNLHGKHLEELQSLWQDLVATPDIVFLQELGGMLEVGSAVVDSTFCMAGEEFILHLISADKAHRCQGILLRAALDFRVTSTVPLPTSLLLHAKHPLGKFLLTTVHLPHAKRDDAEQVWQDTCECLEPHLAGARYQDFVLMGMDANQDLQASSDDFAGMMYLRSLIAGHELLFNHSCGHTWTARGHSSEIDFLVYRNPSCRVSFHVRDDMRQALPSDHVPVWGSFVFPASVAHRPRRPQFASGRWLPDFARIREFANSSVPFSQEGLEHVCRESSRRCPSLRYVDSPELKQRIRLRKKEVDPVRRSTELKAIKDQRAADKTSHKVSLLERAKQGDRAAVAFLRRSAAQSSFECSYIQARGGGEQASAELQDFYISKYRSLLPPPTPEMLRAMIDTHTAAPIAPFTEDELRSALARAKKLTSTGMDAVCYAAVKAYFSQDVGGKLLAFFNTLLKGEASLPTAWKRAKVVLLPKVPNQWNRASCAPSASLPCSPRYTGA